MPLYQFKDQYGFEVEVFFGMDDAPKIGDEIDHEGQMLTRVPSVEGGIVREYRHVSHQLPRVNPNDPYWPHYDSSNRPVCTSRAQVMELQARIRDCGGQGKGFEFNG